MSDAVPEKRSAIECRSLGKTFRIPRDGGETTLRGKLMHPRSRARMEEFSALRDVTFDIKPGEFFGIVGRNGSGKSTLLKVLAGIYQPSAGSLVVDGSIAPFIELGVGFNMDLSATDNVYVNGAILGMSRAALDAALPRIVEFAELDGFMEMKLRNFSSGMLMRLAFAIAVQAEADILLVDEVLAVGDERFQRKCQDVFRERRRRGQTVVFVSHDMSAVEAFCDRAIVLHHGEIVAHGPVAEVVPTYHRLNRDDVDESSEDDADEISRGDFGAMHLVTARDSSSLGLRWAHDQANRHTTIEDRTAIDLDASFSIADHLENARLRLIIFNEAGGVIGELHAPSSYGEHVSISIENSLTPGRYRIVGELFATFEGQSVLADTDALEIDVSGNPVVGSTRFTYSIAPLETD